MLASLLHCLLDILRVEIFASDNDDVLDPATYVQPSKGLGMVSLPDALEARDVLIDANRPECIFLSAARQSCRSLENINLRVWAIGHASFHL
jgi:hypothetical protein